ncbi:alpha/beta hydrolase family esterase [Microbacterium sp. NPDC056569]|uniref:alpha/beta hydrolase family esterase n=1 Tax=Microbacterium sp. NPDC056569 TaxID=3345867 RepID=UPI00366B33EC
MTLPSGADAYVYVPDDIELVSWTAPVVLVLADEPFTAESAKEMAEDSGLAAEARADNAVVTFVNPIGEDWAAADLASYDQIVNRLYIERPTPSTWSNGRANGAANGRDAAYPVVYQGYARRTHVIATGDGADFVSTHLTNDGLRTPLGFPFTNGPASVMLFNTTAVPAGQYYEYPAIVINGSHDVNAKYTSLTQSHRAFIGSSVTTEGFDLSVIGEQYGQLTSVMRAQMMRDNPALPPQENPSNRFVVDISDFDALGVAPEQVDITLSQNRPAMYLSYVPEEVKQTADGTVPLVMIFHGSGERSEWFAMHTDWPALAAKEGFIVVALDDHIGQRTPGNLSTAQVVEVMDDVFARYPQIDQSRVYATGFSAGSFRTNTLGTQRPDLFAAIAPLNGATNPTGANDDLMMPVMVFGGEADTLTTNFPRHAGPTYNGALNSADRIIDQYFRMNEVRGGSYAYDTNGSSARWGLTPDAVETVDAENGDAIFTVNSVESADGVVYTKLVNVSKTGHFVWKDEAPLAWEFFKQFSRNEDGSISIEPSFELVRAYLDQAERDGVLTGNALSAVVKHIDQAEKLASGSAASNAVIAQLDNAARKSGLSADSNVVKAISALAEAS